MVNLSSFCIDPYEVTRGDYRQFLDSSPTTDGQPTECEGNGSFEPTGGWPPAGGEENLPVVFVDWCDARAYCYWAGQHLCGAIGGGPSDSIAATDPTADQWHAACTQGGVSTYPYGDGVVDGACVDSTYDGTDGFDPGTDVAQNVGTAADCHGASSPYDGIYDLSGNVAEWVDTCGNGRCWARGGAFSTQKMQIACRVKREELLGFSGDDVGFRCCAR
jgi:formylglycine-generating enzyme required for sulfatase activity